ncbi:MAG: Gfo/Idh/MocA family oxidoreductase [Ignavibacterium sp.]|nr:MAG: Gfo/Idh/MocA family oxidoreductase [Ignavibacterium sp.]
MKLESVRWGFIGCGDVTEVKSGPAFNKVPNSQVVAVMRRNEEKAKDYAFRHGIPKWYNYADKLINDPDINAIYIATPPSSHCEYTLKAAKANKTVYVEKPMARTHEECLKMIKACKDNDVPLFVAYYRRYLPKFLKVKELIEKDVIGNVSFIKILLLKDLRIKNDQKENLPWRVVPEISGGGHFIDLASHQFDYLDFLFGPVLTANSFKKNISKNYNAEDYISAGFEFKNGVMGSGVWYFSVAEEFEKDKIEIVGEKGRIIFSTFDTDPIKLITKHGTKRITENFPENVQLPLIQAMVDNLRDNGKCYSTGESGSRANRVIDMIQNIN